MKQIVTALVLILKSSFTLLAQKNVENILVSYEAERFEFPIDSVKKRNMLLLFNKNNSKYYNELSQWSDSLSSTPEGKAELKEIIRARCMTVNPDGSIIFDLGKGPVKNIFTYIFTDNSKGELTHYDKWGQEEGYYTEPTDEMKWEIGDSTKNILGYECIIAESDYHGRHWKAWFAPEIPVSFGPWKLRGLPGLILYAESDNGARFTATGLQESKKELSPIYSSENYSKKQRKNALGDEDYYQNNKVSIIKAQYGADVQFSDGFRERPKFDKEKHSLESDY